MKINKASQKCPRQWQKFLLSDENKGWAGEVPPYWMAVPQASKIGWCRFPNESWQDSVLIEIPETEEALTPLLTTIPFQLLSYHIAVMLDKNVDQPRNLEKSVTVE